MAKSHQPTHRVRGKSAPRGRSPDPKALKKAAAAAAKQDAFVTPPPKASKRDRSSSASKTDAVPRKLTFGKNQEFEILAENRAPTEEMKAKKADKIYETLKKEPSMVDFLH